MIVLGVSGGYGHDAAAALVVDGKLVALAEEERFTRVPHALAAAPVRATAYCLAYGGIELGDVDVLALSWAPGSHQHWPLDVHERLLGHPFFAGSPYPTVVTVPHATCHAAAAYLTSDLQEAAVLTVDGQGDGVSTMLGHARGSAITTIATSGIEDSLGFYYLALTNHLGFELGEEGKVMGLASYGTVDRSWTPFALNDLAAAHMGLTGLAVGGSYERYRATIASWRARFVEHFGPPRSQTYAYDSRTGRSVGMAPISDHHASVAASGQAELERVLLHLVKRVVEETGCRDLVLGGGVALNCAANGVIHRSGLIDRLAMFPASGDAGTAAGAALFASAGEHRVLSHPALVGAALGPDFDGGVCDFLRSVGVAFEVPDDIAAATADELGMRRSVGWFQGRMEAGPRALGHRSILGAPTDRTVGARTNGIKHREAWRPFGPSLLSEAADRYLVDSGPTTFMLTAVEVRRERRDEVPAVVHVDGTCRPHTVDRDDGTPYAALLAAVGDRTGHPIVLNTSFNLAGEPLVCTPADAVRTFFTSGLDTLAIGPAIVRKPAG